jgi:hypothetical protein
MSDHPTGTTPPPPADDAQHPDYGDRSARAVVRRIAAGLGIPLEHIVDVGRDNAQRGVCVFGVTSVTWTPEVHVGTAVLTPDEATALARHIRQVVAHQRARGPWSLLRTLVRGCAADLIAHARYWLRCVATYRLRRRGAGR